MTSRSWLNAVLLLAVLVTAALAWAVGGRDRGQPNADFWPEAQMADSPAYDAFAPNPNFPDGLTLRVPPAGTIARGHLPLHYQATPAEALRAGRELTNPFAPDDASRLRRGSDVYANFCQVCHGPLGEGNGPVTQRGFPLAASLLADRAVQMKDGQMFHVLTYGQGRMPALAAQLASEDRWSAILHVRVLQGPYAPSHLPVRSEIVQLFRDNCAACHGLDGTGNNLRQALPLIPDFTCLTWQLSQTELAIVNQIDYGSQPLMPAFRYKLSAEQILGLAVYVRSFAAPSPGQAAVAPVSHLTASSLYGTFCFACHDATGKGNAQVRLSMPELPDFTAAAWQQSRTDAELSLSILQGKGKFMLPMKDKLGAVDVKQMVALVRGFQGGTQVVAVEAPKPPGPPAPAVVTAPAGPLPAPVPPAPKVEPLVAPPGETAAQIRVGANIFRQYCFVCHGVDGTGAMMRASMPPIPDFSNSAFQQEHSDAQLLVSVLDGKGTLMPANRGRVTDEQARALVAYVRAFGPRSLAARPAATDAEFEKKFRQLEEQWKELQNELQKTKGQ
jgi:mono/diheme cytochrome c family protein